MKKTILWKSMQAGMKSSYGDTKWEIGKWFTHNGDVVACKSGFHASKRITDAMSFVDCEVLARVEVKGEYAAEKDKQVWQSMKITEAWEWNKEASVKLAIFAAELTIKNFEKVFPDDKRPREAIEAARKWSKADEKEKAAEAAAKAEAAAEPAAWAAWAAARSAAWAAWAAAEPAAWAAWAAWAAVKAAAWSAAKAAWAAKAAAANKILDECHNYIVKEIIPTLKKIK